MIISVTRPHRKGENISVSSDCPLCALNHPLLAIHLQHITVPPDKGYVAVRLVGEWAWCAKHSPKNP